MMFIITGAGNLGRDAQYKTTQSGQELCSFSVACETGYGDNKQTHWVDVTKWGKGSEGLARVLRKGSRVAFSGEYGTREHDGKTYIQCRADHIKIMSTPEGGQREPDGSRGHADAGRSMAEDLDGDSIPFIHGDGLW